MFNTSADLTHAAFRVKSDPLQTIRQMKLSVAVLALLSLAIGLGASAISPHSGWLGGAGALRSAAHQSLVDMRASGRLPQG